jgi:beta-glucuronidase
MFALRKMNIHSFIHEIKLDPGNDGMNQKWYQGLPPPTIPMPVPASYNDIPEGSFQKDIYFQTI